MSGATISKGVSMPIVDISGFTGNEVGKMKTIRKAIQVAFKERFGLERLEDTNVNFLIDPSLEPSLKNHVVSRIYTKHFLNVGDNERDKVCDIISLLTENHGGHIYNEAFPPGYRSMCGRLNPDWFEE